MSNALMCEVVVGPERPAEYWWPLLFGALRRAGFAFDDPWSPPGWGTFLDVTPEADPDDVQQRGSFRSLWDALMRRHGEHVLATFWSGAPDPFAVEANLDDAGERGGRAIYLTLPLESLVDEREHPQPGQENVHRLRRWLDAVEALHALCEPHPVTLWWQKQGWLVGTIGARFAADHPDAPPRDAAGSAPLRIVCRTLAHGAELCILDPFPVRMSGRFIWLSL